MILGVCKGIADYLDFSLFWTRILTVLFFIFSGFWPVGGLYLGRSDTRTSIFGGYRVRGRRGVACDADPCASGPIASGRAHGLQHA